MIVGLRYRYRSWKVVDRDVSLFCHDCTGGALLHTVNMRFNSPTINMYFPDLHEYCTYLKYIKEYSELPLLEKVDENLNFPCGVLRHPVHGDVHLCFNHDKTFSDAADKWNKRVQRIYFSKVYVLLVMKKKDMGLLDKYSSLPYRKVIITFPDVYPEISDYAEKKNISVFSLKYTGPREIGEFLRPVGFLQYRPIEEFDIIKFFNKG